MAVAVDLEKDGARKKGFVGFSWTTFFFGFFVPLIRGDVKWCLIMLVLALFTAGISNLVFCFIYNNKYTEKLLSEGYKPVGEADRMILVSKRLYS